MFLLHTPKDFYQINRSEKVPHFQDNIEVHLNNDQFLILIEQSQNNERRLN